MPTLKISPLLAAMLIASVSVLSACDEEAPPPPEIVIAEMITLPDGLRVPRPEGFKNLELPGYVSLIDAAPVRSPMDILVNLTSSPQDTRAGAQDRSNGPVPARFTIKDLGGGGSGGPRWELTAWRPAGDKWILMQATQQAELGPPSFHTAWVVFDGISVD